MGRHGPGVDPGVVKRFSFLRKRRDLSDETFATHWRDVHGEMAKDIQRLRRYIQNRRLAVTDLGLPPAVYEGITEVWFDDLEAAEGMGEDPQYLKGCRVDEPNFLDIGHRAFTVTEEEVLVAGPPVAAEPRGVKLMHLVRRPVSTGAEEFFARWGDRGDASAGVALAAGRHVVNRALPATLSDEKWWPDADRPDGEAPFDGIRELWWPDCASFRRARGGNDREWRKLVDPELVDVAGSKAILVEEYCVIWP